MQFASKFSCTKAPFALNSAQKPMFGFKEKNENIKTGKSAEIRNIVVKRLIQKRNAFLYFVYTHHQSLA